MQGNYDIQQICENGHQITGCFNTMPEKRKNFCETCGASTINTCPHCNSEIQGHQIKSSDDWLDVRSGHHRIVIVNTAKVPFYCSNCGKPFPWTENKIKTVIQTFAEFGNLDENEKKTIEEDIANIAKDTPQAELSARRIKKIWGKYGPVCYEILMEFASRTTAKILKNP